MRKSSTSTTARRNLRKFCLDKAIATPNMANHLYVVAAAAAYEEYLLAPIKRAPRRRRR